MVHVQNDSKRISAELFSVETHEGGYVFFYHEDSRAIETCHMEVS